MTTATRPRSPRGLVRSLTLTLSFSLTRAHTHIHRYATSFMEEGWDSLEAVAAMSEAEMLRYARYTKSLLLYNRSLLPYTWSFLTSMLGLF